jgi:hypothetical protein
MISITRGLGDNGKNGSSIVFIFEDISLSCNFSLAKFSPWRISK